MNTLFVSLLLNAITLLVVWPVSTSLGPLIVFVILNGLGNGGFFSATPPVISSLFGSLRMPVVMGMIITGWGPGYLLVSALCSLSMWIKLISNRELLLRAICLLPTGVSLVRRSRIIQLSFLLDRRRWPLVS